ncbi:MAG: DNA-binding beta-propeller fold protein YncE [Planctomycetota bacterium]|jgi:DNA-binding beta-propeller fold protein YncE
MNRLHPMACIASALLALALSTSAGAQSINSSRTPNLPDRGAMVRPPKVGDVVPTGGIDLAAEISCNAAQAYPWAAAYSENSNALYVSMFGGFVGSGGCEVLRLDANSGAIQARISVDEGPEELALRTDAQGNVLQGFVTCSGGSSLVVFDGADQSLTSIALPPDPNNSYPTAFPFGVQVDEARGIVWVGANDSSGRIFAIDIPTLSLDLGRSLQLGNSRSVARFTLDQGRLIVPTRRFTPGFTGSITELVLIDPDSPAPPDVIFLASADNIGLYPSAETALVTPDGRALVSGYDMGAFVYVIDIASLTTLAPIPTHTGQTLGKFQSMALSNDGLLVVVDQWTSELARINSHDGSLIGITQATDLVGFHQAPNAAVFRPDGNELILVESGSSSLARLAVQ